MARSFSFSPRYAVLVASMLALMAALVPCAAQAADSHATPSTFASMFSAAQGGDTVYMAAGSYGSFGGGSKSSVVTVKPEPGAAVSISGGTFNGASNVTVQGVRYTSAVTVAGGSSAITFDGDTFDNLSPGGTEGRIGFMGNSSGTVRNSHIGNGGCSDGIQMTGNGNATVVIDGNEFEGIRQGSCTTHSDPIQMYGGKATITGNYFHNNSTAIMTPDCNGAITSLKNNVFIMDEYPWALVGGGVKNASVTHNVTVGGSLRFYSGNNNCGSSTGNTIRDNAAAIDAPSGNTVDHNQTVTFTGGAGRCGYATSSPKGTASDGHRHRPEQLWRHDASSGGHHRTQHDDHFGPGRPLELDERVDRVQLRRDGFHVRLPARHRRVRRVHQPQGLQRPDHRFARRQRPRHRRGGQHRRLTGDVDLDHQRGGGHHRTQHDDHLRPRQPDHRDDLVVRLHLE